MLLLLLLLSWQAKIKLFLILLWLWPYFLVNILLMNGWLYESNWNDFSFGSYLLEVKRKHNKIGKSHNINNIFVTYNIQHKEEIKLGVFHVYLSNLYASYFWKVLKHRIINFIKEQDENRKSFSHIILTSFLFIWMNFVLKVVEKLMWIRWQLCWTITVQLI